MKQLVSEAIILGRTDYGEADRILTLLTPQYGKLSLLAKGVRKVKSKLAGGIELFSVSTITFIQGRGSVGTLVSTRLVKHYSHIVADLDRTMLGYDLIKQFNQHTEDEPDPEYFKLLQGTFEALDDNVSLDLIRAWFSAQILRLGGHIPNLQTDSDGTRLDPTARYSFSFEKMSLGRDPDGRFQANHIKFLRLLFGPAAPSKLQAIEGSEELAKACGVVPLGMLRQM